MGIFIGHPSHRQLGQADEPASVVRLASVADRDNHRNRLSGKPASHKAENLG